MSDRDSQNNNDEPSEKKSSHSSGHDRPRKFHRNNHQKRVGFGRKRGSK
jgi:hypothetical protein